MTLDLGDEKTKDRHLHIKLRRLKEDGRQKTKTEHPAPRTAHRVPFLQLLLLLLTRYPVQLRECYYLVFYRVDYFGV